jgi:hypothetical protein
MEVGGTAGWHRTGYDILAATATDMAARTRWPQPPWLGHGLLPLAKNLEHMFPNVVRSSP